MSWAVPVILVVPGTEAEGPEFNDRSIALSEAYLDAVVAGGGLPWVMPCTTSMDLAAEYVRRSDGVLFTGGEDLQPKLFTKRLRPELQKTLGGHDPARDVAELCLLDEVFRQRKPLLAICRGLQILNVAFGGTLYVDLPTEAPSAVNHCRMDLKDGAAHTIFVTPGSLLFQMAGKTELSVNSTHHQAIRDLASPFRVTARSPDGIVEAMELGLADRHLLPYLLAVQFHPERLIPRRPEFLEVFRSFAEACARGRQKSI